MRTETMTLNMGPQHPSTHGVLRVVLELDGETVVRAKPIIGYLHTGMEKQAEYKTYTQSIPQTDRMDYLAPHVEQPGAVPGGREAARHRGAGARAGDPRAAHRADPHQRALRLARHPRARHRRDDGLLLLLPRAREGALDLRHGVRRAHDRVATSASAAWRCDIPEGLPRHAARSSSTRCRRTSTSTRRCCRRTRSGSRAPRAWRRSRRRTRWRSAPPARRCAARA